MSDDKLSVPGEAYNDGMRIFLAGASGVIGRRLIPRLVQAGHVVGGLTRSPSKTELLSLWFANNPSGLNITLRPAYNDGTGH